VRESDSDGDVYSGVYAGVDFISSISLALFLFRVSRERKTKPIPEKKEKNLRTLKPITSALIRQAGRNR